MTPPDNTPNWLPQVLADGRATREAVESVRDHVDTLKLNADKEHGKMWAAIRGLKAAIKKKPSKFQVISNSKLVLVIIGALIPATASVYAIHVSSSTAAKVSQNQPRITENQIQVARNCEATRTLVNERLQGLDRQYQLILNDKDKTAGQRAKARQYYIDAVNDLPDVKC